MHARLSILAAALVLSQPALAQSCATVQFPPGYTTGAITGTVQPESVVCYVLDMAPHDNNLRIEVTGRNVVFSFNDGFNANDAQERIEMVPQSNRVEVRVNQLMRSPRPEDFRLTVTFLPPGNG